MKAIAMPRYCAARSLHRKSRIVESSHEIGVIAEIDVAKGAYLFYMSHGKSIAYSFKLWKAEELQIP
jgi:hypothetical protein